MLCHMSHIGTASLVLIEINDKKTAVSEGESADIFHTSMFCGNITLGGTLMFYPLTTM